MEMSSASAVALVMVSVTMPFAWQIFLEFRGTPNA